ncbi:MAG: winged helix DNA-binding protein [Methanobrevibacter sp.]|nr:winged helix DNA-binding protein [Candidatus Methanoflexus mossambicus]
MLRFIGDEIKIPTEIAQNIDISSKHISKYLGELKDKDIVICLNENDKRGRLYKLTPTGEEILKYL